VPDPDYVFAMKAFAGRPEDLRDFRDLRQELGLTTIDAAMAILTRYIPERLLTARVRYVIEDLFDADA
jgi:hypothetical protein